jgi:phospholipid/cholesterol/gamma-HCH transport system substrate-binding protein
MDQSQSDKAKTSNRNDEIEKFMPKRSFSVEFFVGLFTIAALGACAYLAVGLGDFQVGTDSSYGLFAEFDNISGLQKGASVEIAGVPVGKVESIKLEDPSALVRLRLSNDVKIKDDDILSIRTKGIIGDRYIKISRGGSDTYIEPEGRVTETESVMDIEDLIGKFVHQLSNDDDSKE